MSADGVDRAAGAVRISAPFCPCQPECACSLLAGRSIRDGGALGAAALFLENCKHTRRKWAQATSRREPLEETTHREPLEETSHRVPLEETSHRVPREEKCRAVLLIHKCTSRQGCTDVRSCIMLW